MKKIFFAIMLISFPALSNAANWECYFEFVNTSGTSNATLEGEDLIQVIRTGGTLASTSGSEISYFKCHKK